MTRPRNDNDNDTDTDDEDDGDRAATATVPPVLDYTPPAPRVRRWRAVWQLPLLWGVPAGTATTWFLVRGWSRADADWLTPLLGVGLAAPYAIGTRLREAAFVLALAFGLAAYALVGLLFDLLVKYNAEDSWTDRYFTIVMAAALFVTFLLKGEAFTFAAWCFAYGVALTVLGAVMIGMTAVWAAYRLWLLARGRPQ